MVISRLRSAGQLWFIIGVLLEGRIFAIGDVHGCLDELKALLAQLYLTPQDRLIFLGDLINRGPASVEVLRYVRHLRNTRCLLGNHERRLLNFRKSGDLTLLKDYDWATLRALESDDWLFMDNMDVTLEIPRDQTVFVHAGFLPEPHWREQGPEIVTEIQVLDPARGDWGRRRRLPHGVSWQNCWEGPPFVICGHTPRTEVFRRPWSMCIDTGCVYGGKLTACEIHTLELIQVPAQRNYIGKPLEAVDETV